MSVVRASSRTHLHNLYFLQFHPFSSSLSSLIETTSNQHSFAVTYLINSCGFPVEKALSASKNVNFETPDRPDSVIALFENHGFSKTQISKLVMMLPQVLLSDPKKTLLPKLEFFKSKCDSSSDVAKLLSSEPTILKRSLENQIIPSFNILKKFMGSEEDLIYCIKRFARVLVYDLQVFIVPNIEIMREAGVPNANIVSFFKYHPKRFMTPSDRFTKIVNEVKKMGFNPVSWQFAIAVKVFSAMSILTWEKKVEVYKKWGCSEDEILVAFGKYPWCMMASVHKIMRVMEFFVNKMGWDSSFLARSPILIGLSLEKRIVPSLVTMLRYTEKQFLKRIVNCHEEETLELLKLYQEKLALAK